MKNINRRKALSSMITTSIGTTAVVGSMGSVVSSCAQPQPEQAPQAAKEKKPMLMKV